MDITYELPSGERVQLPYETTQAGLFVTTVKDGQLVTAFRVSSPAEIMAAHNEWVTR